MNLYDFKQRFRAGYLSTSPRLEPLEVGEHGTESPMSRMEDAEG
jgi:hypothetical protein